MLRVNSKHFTEVSAIIYFSPLKQPCPSKQNLSLWKTHFLMRKTKTKEVKNFKKLLHSTCCTRLDQIFIPSLSHHWQMPKSSAQDRSEWVWWEAAPECCSGRNWQHRMLSARAAGFVISSFHGLLLRKAQCLFTFLWEFSTYLLLLLCPGVPTLSCRSHGNSHSCGTACDETSIGLSASSSRR